MADFDNITEINENFSTIKTLLNSIRAQGILNTSDVDKVLSGINSKLERLNTEEDIDLIKIFLSELKQNLEERHATLIAKFGAIESLFTNLLKNSSEMLKSSEVKELFDIVATNLSVFSREIVAQKENLTDISLRLDALRSDDTKEKNIIKNIALLKPDLERLNNGFDSIVLSLNDNFKSMIKTISTIDKTEYLDRFSANLASIQETTGMSISAVQILDKKTSQIDDYIKELATKEDLNSTNKRLVEIFASTQDINSAFDELNQHCHKFDNLAEKIDASVNIVVSLKTLLADNFDSQSQMLTQRLTDILGKFSEIETDEQFNSVKADLETIIKNLDNYFANFDVTSSETINEIRKVYNLLHDLNIDVTLKNFENVISNSEDAIKAHIDETSKIQSSLSEAHISHVLQDINSSTESLTAKLAQTQNSLAQICDTNFSSVFEDIKGLKSVLSQIDENTMAANSAIFSSISDRLSAFEGNLKDSLDVQQKTIFETSNQLTAQVAALKDLSNTIDYKLDSSIVELNNTKIEFAPLKDSINEVLALDFVNVVKDLRVDLYASKQELENNIEKSTGELSEKVTEDLFGKYQLIINKLETTEDAIKETQFKSLVEIKTILEKISGSIIDVISYVSEQKSGNSTIVIDRIETLASEIKDTGLNYVENVRDVVDVIRAQVDNGLKSFEIDSASKFHSLENVVAKNTEEVQSAIKVSYNKLLEIQDSYREIKEALDINAISSKENLDTIISANDTAKSDVSLKIEAIKNALLDKIADFKQDFTCENADKINEIRFAVETVGSQQSKEMAEQIENIKSLLSQAASNNIQARNEVISKIAQNFDILKNTVVESTKNTESSLNTEVGKVLDGFNEIKETLNQLDTLIDADMTRQLSIIENNFETLISQISILFEKIDNSLVSHINNEFDKVSDLVKISIDERLDAYKAKIEASFDNIQERAGKQAEYIENIINALKNDVQNDWQIYSAKNTEQIENLSNNLKLLLEDNSKLTANDYLALETSFKDVANSILENSSLLQENVDTKLQEITTALKTLGEENSLKSEQIKESITSILNNNLVQINASNSSNLAEIQNATANAINTAFARISERDVVVNTTVSNLSSQVDKNSGLVENILAKVSNLQGQTLENENTLSSINTLNERQSENLNNIIEAQTENCAKLNNIEDSINNFNNKFENAETQIVSEIADLKDNSLKLNDTVTNLVDLASVNKEVFEKLNNTAENTSKTLENLSEIDSINKNLLINLNQNVDEKSVEILQKINEGIENNNIQNEKLDEFKENLSKASNYAEQNNEIILNVESMLNMSIEKRQEAITSINQSLDSARSSISQLNESILEKAELIKTFAENLSEASNYAEQNNEIILNVESMLNMSIEKRQEAITSINQSLDSARSSISQLNESILEKAELIKTFAENLSEKDLIEIKQQLSEISELTNAQKECIKSNQENIIKTCSNEINNISNLVEKETDIIMAELIEQFDLMKKSQNDDLAGLSSKIEEIITSQLFANIEDIKSYFDVKMDSENVSGRLDVLRAELSEKINETLTQMNGLLKSDVYTTSISDFRAANELLVNDAVASINDSISNFVANNTEVLKVSIGEDYKNLLHKLDIFDKNFKDVLVEKYEEIKLLSNNYNESVKNAESSIFGILSNFDVKTTVLSDKIDAVTKDLGALNRNFEGLKAQISNKEFDEAFQTALNKQIESIKDLICDNLNYIEDINELCVNNLPNVSELSTTLKHSVANSITEISQKIDSQNFAEQIENDLKVLKSDIITQILNIFNQISFVAEQEEILDYIDVKHSELVEVLSHIVITSADVKDSIDVVDMKLDSVKEDIKSLNKKIQMILSDGEEDIDYAYSLRDLESDIANLRLVLNEMKENGAGDDIKKLASSTEEVYSILEALKSELPQKSDIENISEDIVSISTRTNKLILASDESYKTLKDSLQEFKLVINDLDERTRNFAEETGINKIDSKLDYINSMMAKGEKTNQVFNQVFEYLAEWVDNAGVQISGISDKVESLDEIGQIKVMLADLKAEAEDDSSATELVETLGQVFDKQTKRITSLESKLDKIIVETTINNRNNKIDMSPMEDTLNRFLVAIDEKLSSQQARIDSLEAKLESAMSLLEEKETVELSKKVGGMDRRITKLNKTIEKIASHVIEN